MILPPPQKEIDRLLRAEKNKRSLYEFTKTFWRTLEPGVKFVDGFHVKAICDHLQAVTEGIFRNLLICIPPGFAKSTIVSVLWPAWLWVQYPHIRMLCGSYDEGLTHRDSMKCRDVISSKKYNRLFSPPWKISGSANTKNYFENTLHGARKTFYVGSSRKTGWRCNYILVDDPLSAENRYNQSAKNHVNSSWDTVLWSRVNANTNNYGYVVIMQRLCEDDLVGHIIEKYGDDYVKLILPNEFDPSKRCITPIFSDPRTYEGELLCEELLDEARTEECKLRLGPVDYSAQYLHNPVPIGGDRFKSEYFKYWEYDNQAHSTIKLVHSDTNHEVINLHMLQKFISVDYACSEEKFTNSDFTSIGLWAITKKYQLILLHRIKARYDEHDVIEALKSMYTFGQFGRTRPGYIVAEDNGLGKPLNQISMFSGLPIIPVSIHQDKMAMSACAAVRIKGGQMFFPQYDVAPWMHEFTAELLAFPGSKHDDDVSMISLAANSFFEPKDGSLAGAVEVGKTLPRYNVNRVTASLSNEKIFGKVDKSRR